MPKNIFLFYFVITIFSYSNNDNENVENKELLGKWKMTETIVDGSGTFEPVRSNKTVEFKANGSIISNQSLCQMFSHNRENTARILSMYRNLRRKT